MKRYEAPLYEKAMDELLIAPVIRRDVQISALESNRHELQITQESKAKFKNNNAQSVMSSFMPNRNLLPDSDVYLVSSSITNTGIDIYEKYSPFSVQNFSTQKISDSRPYLIFDSSVSCDESLQQSSKYCSTECALTVVSLIS
ncbi:hypothetical protein T11_13424 [Trichinella zimbabwensis]|uniref:Uncharacterized protein n=1 Tax=Trichinella zimbabwensis TaxID=268475 RepID=A0A0V1GQ06_9BILA|nr:hypothetical protein T11_13424 [Trichinella zimbabwensis]